MTSGCTESTWCAFTRLAFLLRYALLIDVVHVPVGTPQDGHSIAVRVSGFRPYFYIEYVPTEETGPHNIAQQTEDEIFVCLVTKYRVLGSHPRSYYLYASHSNRLE